MKIHVLTLFPLITAGFSTIQLKASQCKPFERACTYLKSSVGLDERKKMVGGDDSSDQERFHELYKAVNNGPSDLLRLEEPSEGIRGVYLNRDVSKGDIILSIPLSECLTEQQIPNWMSGFDDESNQEQGGYFNPSAWATRLASVLIDQQLRTDSSGSTQLWFSLLPNPNYLKASLPIHWPDEILRSAQCSALEISVDSMFFARSAAVQDLMEALELNDSVLNLDDAERRRLCEDALDLVQTRTCRPYAHEEWRPAIRVLAPVFDFLNHPTTGEANANFGLEDESVVVRARSAISQDEEVFIDYGESTRPSWKCLSSYGFVPDSRYAATEDEESKHVAEVYIEGNRYEVQPDSIPEDMVAYVAASIDPTFDPEEPVNLTRELAVHMARRISDVAYQLILEPSYVDTSEAVEAETILAYQLAAELRWNQHRILMACSEGLRDFAAAQS